MGKKRRNTQIPSPNAPIGRERFPDHLPVRALLSGSPTKEDGERFMALVRARQKKKKRGKAASYTRGRQPT